MESALSIRVSKILNGNLTALFPQVIHHYWAYISMYQRRRVVVWAKKKLDENFCFDFLTLLLECNARIETGVISSLKKYLTKMVESSSKVSYASGVVSYPQKDPYEDLIQVGYWCLTGDLPKKFSEFVGYSDIFDFYYLYKKFDLLIRQYGQSFESCVPDCRDEIEKACAFMQQHYAERICLDQICRCAGLSKSTLLRAFTKSRGVTPYNYLENIRIGKAKKQLEQGVAPIEAALQTGFSNQSHFTNYFSRFIGLAPGAYLDIFSRRDT